MHQIPTKICFTFGSFRKTTLRSSQKEELPTGCPGTKRFHPGTRLPLPTSRITRVMVREKPLSEDIKQPLPFLLDALERFLTADDTQQQVCQKPLLM